MGVHAPNTSALGPSAVPFNIETAPIIPALNQFTENAGIQVRQYPGCFIGFFVKLALLLLNDSSPLPAQ
jgi:hypothetical protein